AGPENASSAARTRPVSRPASDNSSSNEPSVSMTTGSGLSTPGTAAILVGADASGHTMVSGTAVGRGPGSPAGPATPTSSSSSTTPTPAGRGTSRTGNRARA